MGHNRNSVDISKTLFCVFAPIFFFCLPLTHTHTLDEHIAFPLAVFLWQCLTYNPLPVDPTNVRVFIQLLLCTNLSRIVYIHVHELALFSPAFVAILL